MKRVKYLLAALLVGLTITGAAAEYSHSIQNGIAEELVRLHVIANSDAPKDQALKMKVRDGVLELLSQKELGGGREICLERVCALLPEIEERAKEVLAKNGSDDKVTAYVGTFHFPTKHYENISLPAGIYNALRIVIGEGEGENWWCVIYPQLCYGAAAGGEEGANRLKQVLSEEEYSLITAGQSEKVPVKLKFRVVEWFGKH